MAYNRKNLLTRIIEVQELYQLYKTEETTTVGIYRKHIQPRYHISYDTFHRYLGIPAKAELKKIEEKEQIITDKKKNQPHQQTLNFKDDE